MQATSISWCDWVWNCVRGCSRISPGCMHCYAEKIAARFSDVAGFRKASGFNGGVVEVEDYGAFHGFAEFRVIGGKREAHWTGRVELIEDKLLEPLSWRAKAAKFFTRTGRRPRCFVNSMSDLFHAALPDLEIDRVFAVMALCPEIDFMVLTKRAERMAKYFSGPDLYNRRLVAANHIRSVFADACNVGISDPVCFPPTWIWLGVSVEDQRRANERIPHLLRTPAAVRFLSCEPLLEGIDIREYLECPFCSDPESRRPKPCLCGKLVDWVIVGGESGPGARPFYQDWAMSLARQCRNAETPFLMKQYGSNPWFMDGVTKRIKLKNRSGADPSEWLEDLRVQQFPEVLR